MNRHDDADAPEDFGADYWEDRYRRSGAPGLHGPSPSLVTEAAHLWPGTALDAGCGSGSDAVWLATRGWQVLAVDVSATALSGARETASAAGRDGADRIEWVCADLLSWDPGQQFDLVTSSYVHVPGPASDLFRRLTSWVAPGGTLLVVGHAGHAGGEAEDHGDGDHGGAGTGGHGHPPGAQVRVEDVTAALPAEQWEVVVAELRTHSVRRPGAGTVLLSDVVVRARRTAPPQV